MIGTLMPTVSMALAWAVAVVSMGFLVGCAVADPYAPLRVKIAVAAPWAFFISQNPIFAAVTGT